jgi:hypothetical protein
LPPRSLEGDREVVEEIRNRRALEIDLRIDGRALDEGHDESRQALGPRDIMPR